MNLQGPNEPCASELFDELGRTIPENDLAGWKFTALAPA